MLVDSPRKVTPAQKASAWVRAHNLAIQEGLSLLPDIPRIRRMRERFYRSILAGCGDDLWVSQHTVIKFPQNVSLGSNVYFNRGAFIIAREKVTIGDDTGIGPYATIISDNHGYRDGSIPYRLQAPDSDSEPIVIGRDVWIGAHAVILKGAVLGDGCVVSAGAVVSGTVAPLAIVGGVPARKFAERSVPESDEPPAELLNAVETDRGS
jgi:acetyltransferase-like isoleucine patch superfamily enzyme